jgi:hypothetical protein
LQEISESLSKIPDNPQDNPDNEPKWREKGIKTEANSVIGEDAWPDVKAEGS